MNIVKNIKTLERLEKEGHIKLHPHTGTNVYWNGSKVKAWYIDDAVHYKFKSLGYEYELKYISGCFFPYLFQL